MKKVFLTSGPGSRLYLPSLPSSASRRHVESLGKPHDSSSIPEVLPGKFQKTLALYHLHYVSKKRLGYSLHSLHVNMSLFFISGI